MKLDTHRQHVSKRTILRAMLCLAGMCLVGCMSYYESTYRGKDLVPIYIGKKNGYINSQGEMVIPPRFEWAGFFAANGLAPVQENGKWGYINTKGEMMIPPRFEDTLGFEDTYGLASVKENGKWGYINAKEALKKA